MENINTVDSYILNHPKYKELNKRMFHDLLIWGSTSINSEELRNLIKEIKKE